MASVKMKTCLNNTFFQSELRCDGLAWKGRGCGGGALGGRVYTDNVSERVPFALRGEIRRICGVTG